MYTTGAALATLLLACTIKTGAAQNQTAPWSSGVGDYDVADSFRQPANATGQFSVPSVDLTKPWPGNDSFGDDWEIYAATFSEIDTGDSTVSFPSSQWLLIPEDSFEGDEIDEGWTVCSYPFSRYLWFRESLEEAQDDDDGDCGGVIPQDCIDELVARTDAAEKCDDWFKGPDVESCNGLTHNVEFGFTISNSAFWDITEDIGRRVPSDNGTSVPLFRTTIPDAPQDNQTSIDLTYDQAVSNVVPYLMSYKYRDGDTVHSHTVFKCVRGNNIAEGSREPESVGDIRSGGSSMRVPAAMLLSLMTVFALWV